jgi:hypothetical protein
MQMASQGLICRGDPRPRGMLFDPCRTVSHQCRSRGLIGRGDLGGLNDTTEWIRPIGSTTKSRRRRGSGHGIEKGLSRRSLGQPLFHFTHLPISDSRQRRRRDLRVWAKLPAVNL